MTQISYCSLTADCNEPQDKNVAKYYQADNFGVDFNTVSSCIMFSSLCKFAFVFIGPIPAVYTLGSLHCAAVIHSLASERAAERDANFKIRVSAVICRVWLAPSKTLLSGDFVQV